MKNIQELPRVQLGVFPTPFYRLERISETYGKNIWIKRDDMCGVALGATRSASWSFCWRRHWNRGATRCSPPAVPSPTTPCSPPPVPRGWG